MITVINSGTGNIASVSRALSCLKIQHTVSDRPNEIARSQKLIFPGVGNFFEVAVRLRSLGLDKVLKDKVLGEKTPILGICLGMHLFSSFGEEGGGAEGLNFIKGRVSRHRAAEYNLRLPHIGWNDVRSNGFKIFDSIPDNSCFYFVHSYELITQEPVTNAAYSYYGVDFLAAVQKGHIIGVQFHPEKSQGPGLKLLKNFCEDKF